MPTWLLGPWGYVIAAGFAAMVAGAGTGWTVHKVDHDAYVSLQLQDQRAQTAAVEKAKIIQSAQDTIVLASAVHEAQAQQKIVTETVTVTKEIPVHVSDRSNCITYGLVRVLDAAAAGTSVPAVGLAPGQPDDTCAPISWSAFAAEIADDYGSGRGNAEQLNALEDVVKKQAATAGPGPR